jgi:hypothetical protein
MTQGEAFAIHNNSTGALTINSSGGNLVVTIPAGSTYLITCVLAAGTGANSWDADFEGASTITGTGSIVLSASPTMTGTVTLGTAANLTQTGTNSVGSITDNVFITLMGAW